MAKKNSSGRAASGESKSAETPTPRLRGEANASPKLRLIANGSSRVNALRAVRDAAVAVTAQTASEVAKPVTEETRSGAKRPPMKRLEEERGHLNRLAGGFRSSVFIRLRSSDGGMPAALGEDGQGGAHRRQDVVTAQLTLDEISRVLADPAVAGVEAGERITFHDPVRGLGRTELDATSLEKEAFDQRRAARGLWDDHARRRRPRVLVGVIDVGGFDFAHPDFWFSSSTHRTRFIRIWDQQGRFRDPPSGFAYGSEIRHEQMVRAMDEARSSRLRATEIEPQGLMVVESHATHVASIAAGRSGVCPHAEIAGVSIHLPVEDEDRRLAFYDSTRLVDAVEYLLAVQAERARELNIEPSQLPLVINVSLGTNGHAHDGTSGVNRWLDYVLSEPGRSVVVAAGNAGQEGPVEPGDLGFMLGRIHTAGRIPAEGLTRDLHWVVPGDGEGDFSENELEIWYEPQDLFTVQVRTPGGDWLPEVEPGEFIENHLMDNGCFASVYSDRFAVANGCNRIAIYLSPFFSEEEPLGVEAGTWVVRLKGREIRDGRFHGWIERDDPRSMGRAGRRELWALPSFFAATSNVDASSVSSLACGHQVIAVANLDAARSQISVTSSQGPTRDGRQKPELAAPGTDVLAASGFDSRKRWVAMSGTSMASPFISGLVAQMLAVDSDLTAAQIQGILRRCAQPLPGADFEWRSDAGFGPVELAKVRAELSAFRMRKDKFGRAADRKGGDA